MKTVTLYTALYIILVAAATKSIYSQNLVYNGDFELYTLCPTGYSYPGNLQLNRCLGWYAPTLGTSDYFNSCSIGTVAVPSNIVGFQYPFNGNGYCGFYTNVRYTGLTFQPFQCFLGGITHNFEREYIQTKLIYPLIANKTYKVTFYISLADNKSGFACKNIGALFTVDSVNLNCGYPIIKNPQIKSDNFVTDTLNWTKVEGCFTATGGEQYLTFGNFSDTLDFANDTLRIKELVWDEGAGISYYYIDNVSVSEDLCGREIIEPSTPPLIPNVFTPNKDGNNDSFFLNFQYEKTFIYNRWGMLLFESTKNDSFWDGKSSSGLEVPEGVYYYVITTEDEIYKGYLELLR